MVTITNRRYIQLVHHSVKDKRLHDDYFSANILYTAKRWQRAIYGYQSIVKSLNNS